MSEVPLGAFLSGGIDSSSIVALMSRVSSHPVKTFTMGFEDGSYNELPYAREVATLFATEHTERLVTPDLGALFDTLVPHLDAPFADVSLFPTYMVSRVAREHVTVALSGDGGDELFGGYDAYEAHALASRFASVGAPLVPALAAVGAALPPTGQKKGVVNKFKRFIGGVATAPADLEHYRWMVHLGSRAKRRLYAPAFAAALDGSDVYAPVREVLARGSRDDVLNRQLYTDLVVYLADDILVKVDRMSMATSLETRAPFLDVDVMELAFSMPGDLKVRNGVRKFVLKEAMRGLVPDRILHRKKEGFSIPIKNWLRRELAPLMRDLLAPARIARRGLFEPAEVTRLVDEHVAGRENHAHTLFPLMVFERWADAHLADARPTRRPPDTRPRRQRPRRRPVAGVPAECRGHYCGRGLEGAASRVTGRAGLGAPQDRVGEGDRRFVTDGVEDLGPGDGAALGQRAGQAGQFGRQAHHLAPVGAVAAGQALPQRWRGAGHVGAAGLVEQVGDRVEAGAGDARGRRRAAPGAAEPSHHQVHRGLGAVAGGGVAHAEDRDQPGCPSPA